MDTKLLALSRLVRAMNVRALDQMRRIRSRRAELKLASSLQSAVRAAPELADQLGLDEGSSAQGSPTEPAVEVDMCRFQDLFDLAPIAYVVTDRTGIIRRCNQASANLLNITSKFLAGKPLFAYIDLVDRSRLRRAVLELRPGLPTRQWRVMLTPRDKPAQSVIVRVSTDRVAAAGSFVLRWVILEDPKLADRGPVTEAVAVGMDLAALRASPPVESYDGSNASYRELLDSLGAIIWEADPRSGRLLFVSRHAEKLLGFPRSQWLRMHDSWLEQVLPEDRQVVESTRRNTLQTGRPAEVDYRMRTADGRVIWVRETVSAQFDGLGRPVRWSGVVSGVGKRKKIERQLYNAKRDLAIKLTDLTYLIDLIGRVSAAEDLPDLCAAILAAFTGLLGTDQGLMLFQDPGTGEIVPAASLGLEGRDRPDDWKEFCDPRTGGLAAEFEQPIVMAQINPEVDQPLREPAARLGFRAYYSTPLYQRDGRAVGALVGLFREPYRPAPNLIRLVELFARQVEPMLAMLRSVEQARLSGEHRDVAISVLAHELRNPAAAILYIIQSLRAGKDADREESLQMLESQVEHLVELIGDLTEASRAIQRKIVLETDRVDLREIVALGVNTSRAIVARHGHDLAVKLPDAPVMIEADTTRLVQVIGNLLENAAKYTPGPDGRIVVEVESGPADVSICVRDNGIGISRDLLPHVFELFSQADAKSPRAEGGLGIGLSLARHLVELHGGSITASSQGPGQGAEFIVTLPRERRNGSDGITARPALPVRTARVSKRVLVVDDHEMSARLLARILKLEGHIVEVASDGPGALERVAAFHPEVVLLDLDLPEMSGFEVARRLRAEASGAALTLISVTGEPASDVRSREECSDFNHHLVKPVKLEELGALLEPGANTRPGQRNGLQEACHSSPASN